MGIAQVLSFLLLIGGLVLIAAVVRHFNLGVTGALRERFKHRARSQEDEREAADMHALLARMEERIATLEKILDAESPNWRSRS